ncbi:MAG TPA: sigma 54-interacting transcriptional regulator [Pyrinomonadaceae bacterium]|nr:sigma 54-interacting transcriptional regulator [Pyrinomonadaceae bacterium]
MEPILVFSTDASETETFPLKGIESVTLGRAENNEIVLSDGDVSRCHCSIKEAGGNYYLKDLDSRNGTFLNNEPVKEAVLRHGDCIRIGKTLILFRADENEPNAMPFDNKFQFDNGALVTRSEIRFAVETNLHKMPQDLNALAKLGRALNESRDTAHLQNRFLEIILELIPAAERGVILLFEEDDNPESGEAKEPKSVSTVNRNPLDNEKITVSRTVTERVLNEKIALLSNDLRDSGLENAASLIARRVAALLCVPLVLKEVRGLIYLDSRQPDANFTENHLQQLTAISVLISAALEQRLSIQALEKENARLQTELEIETNLIGVSQEINKVFQLIKKVSPTDSNVLITGESGTGKELVAQTLHRNSHRSDKPFVAINCAVLNEHLLESDLFGHEKGAFTGAVALKRGKLEIADGGTVFLDEVGELAPHLQAKLLRVLQEREFERVGGVYKLKTNVRIIAATNQNLQENVRKGTFREDLFFRLNVVQINVPPLRERKTDIPLLAQHFVNKYSERCNRKVVGLSKKAREILSSYEWTGNVRELENVIERAVVLGSTETILPEDLPEEIIENTIFAESLSSANDFHLQLKEAKRRIIMTALVDAGGNFTEAANALGIHPNNLHRLVKSLGIKEEVKKV